MKGFKGQGEVEESQEGTRNEEKKKTVTGSRTQGLVGLEQPLLDTLS